MKLSEALLEKSSLLKRIQELHSKFQTNGRVVRGTQPDEDMKVILEELYETEGKLEDLTLRINKTNATAVINGKTLIEFITLKKCTQDRLKRLETLEYYCKPQRELREKMETWFDSTISLVNVRDLMKKLQREIHEYDKTIQQGNWSIEILC